jgi:hypothetical protein
MLSPDPVPRTHSRACFFLCGLCASAFSQRRIDASLAAKYCLRRSLKIRRTVCSMTSAEAPFSRHSVGPVRQIFRTLSSTFGIPEKKRMGRCRRAGSWRKIRARVKPSTPGILMSIKTKSGRNNRARSTAVLEFVSTSTVKSPDLSSKHRMNSQTGASSSTQRILGFRGWFMEAKAA